MGQVTFYGVREDLLALLAFVFDETDCAIYEAYSEPDEDLREFRSAAELDAAFDVGTDPHGQGEYVNLALWSPSTGGRVEIRRFELKVPGHTHRHEAVGWGLFQLQLGGLSDRGITSSWFAHNTRTRAETWSDTYTDMEPPETWDWEAVERLGRRITYQLRTKLAAERVRGRAILHHAHHLRAAGTPCVFLDDQ
jgi:hypothetical protein